MTWVLGFDQEKLDEIFGFQENGSVALMGLGLLEVGDFGMKEEMQERRLKALKMVV